jgi:hypothetical protein
MVPSAEVRWFIPTELPEDVLGWFTNGRKIEPELSRDDEYLVFPGSASVGVKLRQERFEIKALVSPPRTITIGHGIAGRTDQWVKWSFAHESLKQLLPAFLESGQWVTVTKKRYLRRFSAGAAISEVDQGDRPGKGCNVELTRIEVKMEPSVWFSLGFEAFGEQSEVARILEETLRVFFTEHGQPPGVKLEETNSLSYPVWLASLSAGVE